MKSLPMHSDSLSKICLFGYPYFTENNCSVSLFYKGFCSFELFFRIMQFNQFLCLILLSVSGFSVVEKPNKPNGAESTYEKGPSVGPIAAGVGVTFVVMGLLMGFIVYRMRR